MNVHSSISPNSQKMETIQVSTDSWMDKQDVVYTYDGVVFSHKKGIKFWYMLQYDRWTLKILQVK